MRDLTFFNDRMKISSHSSVWAIHVKPGDFSCDRRSISWLCDSLLHAIKCLMIAPDHMGQRRGFLGLWLVSPWCGLHVTEIARSQENWSGQYEIEIALVLR